MRTLRHDGVLEIYRSDLQVGKAGPNPEGGFLVDMIRVQGKVRDASDDMLSVVPGSGLCFTVPCPQSKTHGMPKAESLTQDGLPTKVIKTA